MFGDAEVLTAQNSQNPRLPLLTQDATREGTDLLINDVISMEVSVLISGLPSEAGSPQQPAFVNLFDGRLYAPPPFGIYPTGQPHPRNPGYYDPVPVANRTRPAVFDTWSQERNDVYDYSLWATVGNASSVPIVLNTVNRLVAIKITIRVWDQKTQQARAG